VDYKTDEKKLKKEFEVYGPVKSLKIVRDLEGKSRGYAFVEFEHKGDYKEAYKRADRRLIDKRRINVDHERGHTDKDFKPRRFGGKRGETRGLPANLERELREVRELYPEIVEKYRRKELNENYHHKKDINDINYLGENNNSNSNSNSNELLKKRKRSDAEKEITLSLFDNNRDHVIKEENNVIMSTYAKSEQIPGNETKEGKTLDYIESDEDTMKLEEGEEVNGANGDKRKKNKKEKKEKKDKKDRKEKKDKKEKRDRKEKKDKRKDKRDKKERKGSSVEVGEII
jgi:U1 small nuclear ribonucleoprotein